MCPAATKLSNILQFVKASYCEGEIDTERRREAIDLCVLHICLASPQPQSLRVKSSDPKLTVNWLVMVAKPADINQSDFSPRLSEEAFFFLFCPGLSSDPVVILFLKLKKKKKNLIMVKCMSQRFTDASQTEPEAKRKKQTNNNILSVFQPRNECRR